MLNTRFKISTVFITIMIFLIVFMPGTPQATPKMPKNNITYLAFGDSLTEGLLENRVLSESGGYYQYIVEALISKGYKIQAANFAKSGATSTEIIAQLHHLEDYPNGIDMVTVSMGLNDLRPYLYTLSNQSFQTDVADAHTILNVFQENIEETKENVKATKKSFAQLEKNLVALQAFMDTTKELIKKDPIFSDLEDINNWDSNVNKHSNTIENTLENIKSTKNGLSVPKENMDEQSFIELKKELNIASKQLTTINTHVAQTLSTFIKKYVPVELGPALEMTQQAVNQIEKIEHTTKEGKAHLKASYKSLKKLNKSYEKVPAAQSVIKKSVKIVDHAFDQANQELSVIGANIATFIDHARKVNPDVDIYILGYYNTKPYVSGALQEKMVSLLTALNKTIESTATTSDATFIPSFDAFDGRYEELLPNPNDIHPSQVGYEVLAEQFIIAMNSNYPTITRDMTKADHTATIIEQAEENVAKKNNKKQDNKKVKNIWLETLQNPYVIPLIIGTILILTSIIRIWHIKSKRLL